jgi:hypothetical protein
VIQEELLSHMQSRYGPLRSSIIRQRLDAPLLPFARFFEERDGRLGAAAQQPQTIVVEVEEYAAWGIRTRLSFGTVMGAIRRALVLPPW